MGFREIGRMSRARSSTRLISRSKRRRSAIPWYLIVAVGLAALVVILVSQRNFRSNAQSPEDAYYQLALRSIERVAKGDPAAENIVTYFKSHHEYSVVDHFLYTDIEKRTQRPGYSGKILLQLVRNTYKERTFAALYDARSNSISTFIEDFNPDIYGLVLLHEIQHAWENLELGINYTPNLANDGYVDEELRAHDLARRLANNLTKGGYNDLIRQIVRGKGLEYPSLLYQHEQATYDRFDALFGRRRSDSEFKTRSFMFLYGISSYIIEQSPLSSQEKWEAKRKWYRENA